MRKTKRPTPLQKAKAEIERLTGIINKMHAHNNEIVADIKNDVRAAEIATDRARDRAEVLNAEIQQAHAFIDAIGSAPRNCNMDRLNLSTRLAIVFGRRNLGIEDSDYASKIDFIGAKPNPTRTPF